MAAAINDAQVVDEYVQDGDLAKLLRLPSKLDDFSETSIVMCVQCFMKATEKQLKKATQDIPGDEIQRSTPWEKNGKVSPMSASKCYALNVMLRQRFSPQYLQEAARIMSFDCVLNLAKYLQFLLSWSPMLPEVTDIVPSVEQVLDWLNSLIDAHFQQMKLADDAREFVETLHQQVTFMAQAQLQTKALQGALAELKQQFNKKQKNTKIGNYCIEVISF